LRGGQKTEEQDLKTGYKEGEKFPEIRQRSKKTRKRNKLERVTPYWSGSTGDEAGQRLLPHKSVQSKWEEMPTGEGLAPGQDNRKLNGKKRRSAEVGDNIHG